MVNFHAELRELLVEARYLDRFRFPIPPVALQARRRVQGAIATRPTSRGKGTCSAVCS